MDAEKVIDFATGLTHPCTSKHPFYRFVFENPPEGITFRLDDSPPAPVERGYAREFTASCPVNGQALNQFVGVKNSLPPSDSPVLVPTYPEYLGPRKQYVWVEDWTTLLSPWVLNGRTKDFDMEAEPHVPALRHLASRPEFGGVITHMHSTVDDVKRLLRTDKVFWVPLALPMPEVRRERADRVRFLFTNSFGGQPINFRLRGGEEILAAFQDLIERGVDAQLTVLGTIDNKNRDMRSKPRNLASLLSRFRFEPREVSDAELAELYQTHDVFLIPGCRLHSVAVARAMSYGMPVVCSDGWGYREYVTNGENGLACTGQNGLTTWYDKDGMLREHYAAMPSVNATLIASLVEKMSKLADRGLLEFLSRNARRSAEKMFDVERRNRLLADVLIPHART